MPLALYRPPDPFHGFLIFSSPKTQHCHLFQVFALTDANLFRGKIHYHKILLFDIWGLRNITSISHPCNGSQYSLNLFKGKVLFSTLEVTDEQGNTDAFDPVTPHHFYQADKYLSLLYGLIEFIKEKHLRNDKYVELVELLGHEYTLSEAAEILDIPYRTLYGWLKTLRPIFDEYMNNTDYI